MDADLFDLIKDPDSQQLHAEGLRAFERLIQPLRSADGLAMTAL